MNEIEWKQNENVYAQLPKERPFVVTNANDYF